MAHLSQDEKLKMKNVMKITKSLNKEMNEHNLGGSSPETEDVDLKNVIHPLSYYIHDREQMTEEMFSIIKGEKLRKMLPPLLKNYTLEELKADCLVHLLGMSKKRIYAILEGRELNSSSDSESESSSSSSESDEIQSPNNKSDVKLVIDDDDLLDISVSKKDVDALMKDKSKVSGEPLKKMRKKIKTEKNVAECPIIISDDDVNDEDGPKKHKKISRNNVSIAVDKNSGNKHRGKKVEKNEKLKNNNNNTGSTSENTNQDDKSDKGKTLLDILELEMRARAIRALLKNTPNLDDEEPSASACNVKIESESEMKKNLAAIDSVVDSVLQISEEKSSSSKTNENLSDSYNDIEIIDVTDVDLCVTIDDNDEICVDSTDDQSTAVEAGSRRENDTVSKDSTTEENCVPREENTSNISPADGENSRGKSADNASVNDGGNPSWSERWAQNKNVKEIVRNSKICANIRKRMRFARMLKQKQSVENKPNDEVDFGNVDESSVAHYNLIKAYNSKNQASVVGDEKRDCESYDSVGTAVCPVLSTSNDTDARNISSEGHASTILENDPKTLILDVSDDDVCSIFQPKDQT